MKNSFWNKNLIELSFAEKAKNVMLNVLFPVVCFGCGKEGTYTYICKQCEVFMVEAAFVCPVCQHGSFTGERHQHCKARYGLDGLIGIWEYEGFVKQCISQIKYQGVTHAIGEIVERAFGVMAQNTQRADIFLSFLLSEDTFLTYVPMAKSKEKKRGFNQAVCLAREIGKITKKEVLPLLQKIRDTHSQTELDKKQRLENVKGSFQLQSEIQIPKNVVLVDDVWTTGATLKECCKVLKRAGAENVWGFTLARTP
jgi:ComF family protein